MTRPSIGWSAGVWATVCVGLAAVVAYQLATSFPLAPTVTAAPPSAPPLELAERPEMPPSPSDDAIVDIVARPLFSEQRRPYVPPPASVEEVVEAAKPALPLELAGVFITPTDKAALILVSGRPSDWLRTGQSVEGWKIETIEQDRVQLQKGGKERELLLREDAPAPATSSHAARRDAQKPHQQTGNEPDPGQASLREMAQGLDDQRRQQPGAGDEEAD